MWNSKLIHSLIALSLVVLCTVGGVSSVVRAQQDERVQFADFILQAYKSYERKDRKALIAVFSANSPYLPQFKQFLDEQFTANEKVKFELKRVLILSAKVENDEATLRVLANMTGTDTQTGLPADRMPEWDHTLVLRREGAAWKVWRTADTAGELASNFLSLTGDDQRTNFIKANAPPITSGLLQGLQEEGRSLLEDRGEIFLAIEVLNLAAALAEETKNIEAGAGALVGLGDAYAAQGDYVRAANNYQQILSLAEKVGSKEGVAAVAVKMGNLHTQQGNLAQAMDYYQSSVKAYEELGSRVEIAYPLAMLGNAFHLQGLPGRALDLYQQSLQIYRRVFSKSGEGWLLHKIAEVYQAQGDNEAAISFYEQSLKLQEELGNKLMIAQSLNGLAAVRLRQGNSKEAFEFIRRAVALARTTRTPEILWKALTAQGDVQLALKDRSAARQSYSEAIDIVEKLRGGIVGNEREQQLYFESKSPPYLGMVELSLAEDKPVEAFTYSERAKGRLLLDVLRSGKADISSRMTETERRQEQALSAAETALSIRLRRASLTPHLNPSEVANLEARLQKARLDYEAYETRIYAAHPELKVDRGEAQPISMQDVASVLKNSHSALLEYVITREKVYLFVLTLKDSNVEATVNLKVYPIPLSRAELGQRIRTFRRKISENALDFKEPARQLYDLLLQPAAAELAAKEIVTIVPSNELWDLPFQALMPADNMFFLEQHALFYVPSLSVLSEIRKREDGRRGVSGASNSTPKMAETALGPPQLLAFGNPALGEKLVSRAKKTMRDIPLTSLPEAEREVKALGEIYGRQGSKVLTGKAAQEEVVKAEAGNYPILHFATHGLLDNSNPLYSRLLLSNSTDAEDGFLEAREIMKLKLHAKLVVLSACQTALGSVGEGEGLIGMSWALFLAGASTTVTSQWKVDSTSTARLMIDFHRLLRDKENMSRATKAQTLRQASLNLMSDPKLKHPFYWAGFVVVGDGR